MGVGGYFSTKAERDNYNYLLRQTHQRMQHTSMISVEGELYDVFSEYGLDHKTTQRMARCLYVKDLQSGDALTCFIMKFSEGVEPISKWRVYISAATIGLSYFVGGLIPMVIRIFHDNLSFRSHISFCKMLTMLCMHLSLLQVSYS
jgi:vacuolar iron transporter family protein